MDTEPLLSVDAIDGWRMRSMTGADTVLGHGINGCPFVTVLPLELLCELDSPRASGVSKVGRVGVAFTPFTSADTGESGGDAKGAIAFGALAPR
jgi:hypothetical protein